MYGDCRQHFGLISWIGIRLMFASLEQRNFVSGASKLFSIEITIDIVCCLAVGGPAPPRDNCCICNIGDSSSHVSSYCCSTFLVVSVGSGAQSVYVVILLWLNG